MSVMGRIFYDIQEAFIDGDTPERIAEALNVPVKIVTDALVTMGVGDESDYDDSMDGDAASALASAGWGTDEDYGGGCDYL